MCLDDAHELRPKARSYDAWQKAQLEQRLAAEYPREQHAPEEDELVKEYKDRRG